MNTLKPKKLKKGDTVGIISPSAFIDASLRDQFNHGVKFLENLGLRVKVGKNVFNRNYYSAGTPLERVEDLHAMFKDPEVKAIIQSQGGNTENQILDYIDWNLIRKNPKLFCGMSDGTNLLLAIYARSGLVTLHGPDLLWGYGLNCSAYESDSLKKVLFTGEVGNISADPNHIVSDKSLNSSSVWKTWQAGKAEGILIGGNISTIASLHGTKFEPNYNESILFIEGVHQSVEILARNFTYLRQAGILENLNGVILGYFDQNMCNEDNSNRPIGEVFLEVIRDYDYPVLEIGEIGHNTANVNLPIGVKASIELDSVNQKFIVSESVLE